MRAPGIAAPDEAERPAILAAYPVDGASLAGQLDRLAELAARICDAPVGLVSLVEAERQVFIGRHGTQLRETPREHSFCAHAMMVDGGMTVCDASLDPRFADNPLVTGPPGIRFYAGVPLRSAEGAELGAFCIIDAVAREGLEPAQREALETLALAAMGLLERERLEWESDARDARSADTIEDLERRFEVLADAMPQLVWSTTANGLVDYFNRGWCAFTGHPPERSYGSRWLNFLHPDDLAATELCWLDAVSAGKSYEIEYRLLRHDGAYRWMLARGEPMRDAAGSVTRWIGTCTDIHEQ